jgi:hypothetical protein
MLVLGPFVIFAQGRLRAILCPSDFRAAEEFHGLPYKYIFLDAIARMDRIDDSWSRSHDNMSARF